MRVFWKRPAPEAQIVRPGNKGDEYEIWVLTPVLVGSIQRAGTQRVLADGIPYTNLSAAARHVLENLGHTELAGEQRLSYRGPAAEIKVSGLDLVAQNAWVKFCERRKINPKSIPDLQKTYQLTKQEMTDLGLK